MIEYRREKKVRKGGRIGGVGRKERTARCELQTYTRWLVRSASSLHAFHITQLTMASHMEIPEILQSASINRNPDPAHDVNPSTAASEKQPVVIGPDSDSETNSIASDIIHPSRAIRPVHRKQTLPPLPDLRFEQSYLASIKDAETWGRVAWITTRDQVRLVYLSISGYGLSIT